jgi:hypothetical protein
MCMLRSYPSSSCSEAGDLCNHVPFLDFLDPFSRALFAKCQSDCSGALYHYVRVVCMAMKYPIQCSSASLWRSFGALWLKLYIQPNLRRKQVEVLRQQCLWRTTNEHDHAPELNTARCACQQGIRLNICSECKRPNIYCLDMFYTKLL